MKKTLATLLFLLATLPTLAQSHVFVLTPQQVLGTSNATSLQGVPVSTTLPQASQCLQFNGTYWAAVNCVLSGNGANTSLSNLAAVAINTTLLPGTVGGAGLGSPSLPFTDLFLGGTANMAVDFNVSGLTTNRTITVPDASGTLMYTSTPLSLAQTPLTSTSDLLTVSSGALARLPIGANGTCLGASGGILAYITCGGGGGGGGGNITVNGGAALTYPINLQNGPAFSGLTVNALALSASNVAFQLSGTATESLLPSTTCFTDQNCTFGAHTYDFSASTLVKQRVTGGATTSANGDLAYDTSANNWHIWQSAADRYLGVWSSLPTNGNCVQANVVSSVVFLQTSSASCTSNSIQVNAANLITPGTANLGSTTSVGGITVTNPSANLVNFAIANLANASAPGSGMLSGTLTSPLQNDVICVSNTGVLVNCTLGIPVVTVNTTPYAITTLQRGNQLILLSGASALTIAQAGSAGFGSNFEEFIWNLSSGVQATLTPNVSNITGGSTNVTSATVAYINAGAVCQLTSDNTNYWLSCFNQPTSTFSFPLTVAGTVNSGGIPYFNSAVQMSSSAALTVNVLVKGGGAGAAPSNSLATDNGTTLAYTGTGGITTPALLATGIVDGKAPVAVITATTFNFGSTYKSGYSVCEDATAAAACTGTLPTAAAGLQYCAGNGYNGSNPNTGVVTFQTSAAGQYIIGTAGTLSASGGYIASSGAAADFACVFGVDTTHWYFRPSQGTWTLH